MTVSGFKKLVKDLVMLYIRSIAVKKLFEFARTPGPDIQFSLPIVGYECDVFVTLVDKKPNEDADFLLKTTVNGITFFVFWQWKQIGGVRGAATTQGNEQ